MHNGDDSAYYLSRGWSVVAIEANPAMAALGERRFAREIAEGRLTILNYAIHHEAAELPFYLSENTVWSSFDPHIAGRHGMRVRTIPVRARRFEDVLCQYGVPYYLKVDIEGLDGACLDALLSVPPTDRPVYVSWESAPDAGRLVDLMASLGYDGFKFVRQTDLHVGLGEALHPRLARVCSATLRRLGQSPIGRPPAHPEGSSGPFGEDLPSRWLSSRRARAQVRRLLRSTPTGEALAVWWDIHARRTRPLSVRSRWLRAPGAAAAGSTTQA